MRNAAPACFPKASFLAVAAMGILPGGLTASLRLSGFCGVRAAAIAAMLAFRLALHPRGALALVLSRHRKLLMLIHEVRHSGVRIGPDG